MIEAFTNPLVLMAPLLGSP